MRRQSDLSVAWEDSDARPEVTGFVSDGDGALAALSAAAKLLDMQKNGDYLEGDVIISTHICPDAPTRPHEPVPFMDSPVEMAQVNAEEVSDELDAIVSVDTTKGNRIINHRGFAVSNCNRTRCCRVCNRNHTVC